MACNSMSPFPCPQLNLDVETSTRKFKIRPNSELNFTYLQWVKLYSFKKKCLSSSICKCFIKNKLKTKSNYKKKTQHGFCYDVIIGYCAVTEIHFSETVFGCGVYNTRFCFNRLILYVFLINKIFAIYKHLSNSILGGIL